MARQRLMNDHVGSESDFRKVLDAICLDLGQTRDYFTLFKNLMAAKQGIYTKAMSQSQTFWSLVCGGLQEATLSRLCRAYDQHTGALTLRTLVEIIKQRPAFLPAARDPIDEAQLDADLASVSREKSRVVKHLMMWRDKLTAHRDAAKVVGDRALGDEFPITYDELDALIDNGFRIVNRYSVSYFSTSSLPGITGADDYLKVLRSLQDDVEARAARLLEELKQALEFERTIPRPQK